MFCPFNLSPVQKLRKLPDYCTVRYVFLWYLLAQLCCASIWRWRGREVLTQCSLNFKLVPMLFGKGWKRMVWVSCCFLTYLTKVPFSKEAGTWHSNGQQLSWKCSFYISSRCTHIRYIYSYTYNNDFSDPSLGKNSDDALLYGEKLHERVVPWAFSDFFQMSKHWKPWKKLKVAGRKGTWRFQCDFWNLLWKKACCTLLSLEACYVHSKQHISIVRRHFRESIRNTPHKRLNGPIDITLCVLMSLAPGIKHARVYQTPRERVKVLLIYLPRTQSATSKQVSKWTKYDKMLGKYGDSVVTKPSA